MRTSHLEPNAAELPGNKDIAESLKDASNHVKYDGGCVSCGRWVARRRPCFGCSMGLLRDGMRVTECLFGKGASCKA